jgi:hypothetical protein
MDDNPYASSQADPEQPPNTFAPPGVQGFFRYRGVQNWALTCAVAFIVSHVMWHASAYVRRWDFLELPLSLPFSPLAPFVDPHDGMVNSRDSFLLGLFYWICLFGLALLVSRRRINPAVPTAVILLLTCTGSIVYAFFAVFGRIVD